MKEYEKLASEYHKKHDWHGSDHWCSRSGFVEGFLKAREMAVKVWHETKGDCYITTRDLENLGEKEI